MNIDESFAARENCVLDLLNTAARVERKLDRTLSNIRGISFSEYRLLRSLQLAPQSTAMRVDLAAAVGLTASAVTRALRPLEKLGYVTTSKSDRDARRSLATLTNAGVELLSDARGVLIDVLGDLPVTQLESMQLDVFTANLRGC